MGRGRLKRLVIRMRWRSAVELALTLFGVFLTVAPALAPDQKMLAAEINNKTLKAAAAIKISPRLLNRRIRD